MISLFCLQFLIQYSPYETTQMNQMEMFNEGTLLVCFYMSYAFTEITPYENEREKLGWVFIGIALLNILVNFCGIIKTSALSGMNWLKKKRSKAKQKINQVQHFEEEVKTKRAIMRPNMVQKQVIRDFALEMQNSQQTVHSPYNRKGSMQEFNDVKVEELQSEQENQSMEISPNRCHSQQRAFDGDQYQGQTFEL